MGRQGLTRRSLLVGGLVVAGTLTVGPGRAWATGPPFVDCAGWGARPPNGEIVIHPQRPVKILVHHTATPNQDDLSRAAADLLARNIQNFHMDRRGWGDTGQHLTISRGGFALEGRHRSLEVLHDGHRQVEGAHCTGQNVVSVGIECEGTYGEVDPPPPLWERLRETCAHICRQYGIAPTEIFGHRDFKNTACPGNRLYGALPNLRTEVAGLLGRRVEGEQVHKASWPLLGAGDTGPDVLAAQHLLRAAGQPLVEPTGRFDGWTDLAVRVFQARTGAEEVNGLLGAETWPVLAATANRAPGLDDVRRALDALAAARRTESVPPELTLPAWQRLLGTGGAPVDLSVDPPRLPR